jgi:hypothetical protein
MALAGMGERTRLWGAVRINMPTTTFESSTTHQDVFSKVLRPDATDVAVVPITFVR